MPEFNFSTFDSSLLPEIKNYLAQKNASHLLNLSKGKLTEVSTELFKELLVDMGLKTFIGWNLTHVDFKSIDHDLKKSNKDSQIFVAIDFSYANLTAVQLDDLNFSNSSFIGANLKNTNLSNSLFNAANFSLADLNGAKLSKAQFIAANLIKATLNYVNGTEVNFNKANLKHAKLNHAYLSESDFLYADLSYAELNMINLDGSNLRGVNLNQAQINHAKLIETVWTRGYLKNANFKNSVLTAAIFEHANLQEVKLTHANLQEAQLSDADFFGADLYGCNLQQADLSRANLTQVILRSANLNYANLRGANLNKASLLHTSVIGVNLEGSLSEGINFNSNRLWYGSSYEWSLQEEITRKKYPLRASIVDLDAREDAISLLHRCFPTQWRPPSDCHVSWSTLDLFKWENQFTCDVKEIVIDSQSFLGDCNLKNDETERRQWLLLAEGVTISGNAIETLKNLILYEKKSAIISDSKQYIINKAAQLPHDFSSAATFDSKDKTLKLALLLNKTLPAVLDSNALFSFNTTLFNINTIFLVKNNNTDVLAVDFLSYEIRELLEIIRSISIKKWPSETKTIFSYQLKLGASFNDQQLSWLRAMLDMTRYPHMLKKYPKIFNPCQVSCLNFTVSDAAVMRYMLTQLINLAEFKKPIENFGQNISDVWPYRTILQFIGATLMIDEKKNIVGYVNSNQSVTEIIQTYLSLTKRLNISLSITKSITAEVILINPSQSSLLHNHLTYDYHVVQGEKMIISGYDNFNITQLPLPDVTLHGSKQSSLTLLDFGKLAQQINKNFNTSLFVKLFLDNNDLILNRFLQISTEQPTIPVISIRLKNALIDRWYQNLEIIPNVARTKVVGRGLNMHLKPLPFLIIGNDTTDFLNVEKIEEKSAVVISAHINDYVFLRTKQDLIVADLIAPYFLILQNFYKTTAISLTHTLEFIDKKIVLSEQKNAIFNAPEDWNQTLKESKSAVYTAAYQAGRTLGFAGRLDACYKPEVVYSNYLDFRRRRAAISVEQTSKTETDLVIYSKKPKSNNLESIAIMIPLPASACLGGLLSAHFDHLGEMYQEKCPSLPAYMTYGFKPFMLALISSGSNAILFNQDEEIEEKFARFFTYFMFNFLGVIVGQPLTQKIAETIHNKLMCFLVQSFETIHNKLMCFLVQSLTWALLWNPSLFASEYLDIIPVVCMQLLQGLFFKTGEETYTLAKKTCNSPSSFWRKKVAKSADQDQVLNKGEIKPMQIAFG